MHEGVEIEGGVEGVGEAVEKFDLEGLDADVVWGGGGGGIGRRAVVAFEGFGGLRGGAVERRGEVAAGCGGTTRFGGGGHESRRALRSFVKGSTG